MKERPILYSPQMVLARREGRKTQTRRIVEPQPPFEVAHVKYSESGWGTGAKKPRWCFNDDAAFNAHAIDCPKGKPGDRLWVQENHRMRLGTKEREVEVEYSADDELGIVQLTEAEWEKMLARQTKVTKCFGPIIPGRFMYRSLSRGLDEITAVRCERVQDITEEDAEAEGVNRTVGTLTDIARYNYAELWKSINGPESWKSNPFVWVITFKVIQ